MYSYEDLNGVIRLPDPKLCGFYITHDVVLRDETPGRTQSVKSLTDDTKEMKYTSAPMEL